jgi:hypothetical protein
MKKLLGIMVLGLFFYESAHSNEDVAKIIENCADNAQLKEDHKFIENYRLEYGLQNEIKITSENLESNKRMIVFLEEEIDLIENKWDDEEKFFKDHYNEYLSSGLLNKNVSYLSLFSDKWLKTITGELRYQDRYRKKIMSNYFVNKDFTYREILKALDDNRRWVKEKEDRINYWKTEKGKNEFNLKLNNKVNLLKKSISSSKKKELKDKLNNSDYVELFKLCEQARMESPILFDTKFK